MKKKLYGKQWIGKQYQVGRYFCTIEDIVAEGGFALVFLVRGPNGQKLALKRVSVNEQVDLNVCKQEIDIMKLISGHKNAITFLDSAINVLQPGIYEVLMLMEMCKGNAIDLMNEHISTGFTEKMVMNMFCGTCEVLAMLHYHQPPILHRDLKVENILVKESGDFVLCDFGSATTKIMNPNVDKVHEIEDNLLKYTTISYRSPEMVDLYSGHVIDTKSDIWALGCLLYKFCFFVPPFGESTLAIQTGNFTFPENSKYSKELHNLISFILEPDPTKRPNIYQVSSAAFRISGRGECPISNMEQRQEKPAPQQRTADTVDRNAGSSSPAPPRQVYTTVAPVKRPVATSLAPRQRPKGNNAAIDTADEESAAAFKNETKNCSSGGTSSGLRRSHSLKEVSNRPSQQGNESQQNQLNQQTLLMGGGGLYQQATEQAYRLAQQQKQQQEMYMQHQHLQQPQQQQQQYQQVQYYQQQEYARQQQLQQQQAAIQQQQMIQHQQSQLQQQQHQMELQRQRKMLFHQQEQDMQMRQELKNRQHHEQQLFLQRQQEYSHLQKMHEDEQRQSQPVVADAPNPFTDDFTRSSPDLSNPFIKDREVESKKHPETVKKTHNRSRSETYTRFALQREAEKNLLQTPLDIKITESQEVNPAKNVTSVSPNPFLINNDGNDTNNPLIDNEPAKDNNVGVLLELDDGDEQFAKLQQLLADLGVADEADGPAQNRLNVADHSRSTAHSDDSPLISPVASSPASLSRYKYVYQHTASCSSSDDNNESSDDDAGSTDEIKYKDADAHDTSSGAEIVNIHEPVFGDDNSLMRDIFDCAPFAPTIKKSTHATKSYEKRPPKKLPVTRSVTDAEQRVSSPFDDTFTSSIRITKKKPVDGGAVDPFGMAPMTKSKPHRKKKDRSEKSTTKSATGGEKFEKFQNKPADPFGSAPFVTPIVQSDNGTLKKKRYLPKVPTQTNGNI